MKNILTDLLNLFYPRLCLLCQNPLIKGENHICLHCSLNLPFTHFTDKKENPVYELFSNEQSIVGALSLIYFKRKGYGQKLIHALKYQGCKTLGYDLGYLAATTFTNTGIFDKIDFLVPVPLHPQRLRQRGYNQSTWIAQGIQSVTEIPIDTTSLIRIKKTESQTHKQLNERQENVQNIFHVNCINSLQDKHILLIDDVITTGSTLKACIHALRCVPGIQISILSIAIA